LLLAGSIGGILAFLVDAAVDEGAPVDAQEVLHLR